MTKRIGDSIVLVCGCGESITKRIDWLKAHKNFKCPKCGAKRSSQNILMVTDGVSPELDAIRDMMRTTIEETTKPME